MTNPNPHQQFADCLLRQETRISDAQLGEYRHQLDRRLTVAVRQERRMRLVTMGMAVIFLSFTVAPILYPLVFPILDRLPDTAVAIVLAVYLTCVFGFVPFLLLYFLQYRRKVQQLQQLQILAILEQLELEVNELRQKALPRDTK